MKSPHEQALELAIEALKTLKVAVNDKQPDPGAVNFIEKTLFGIQALMSQHYACSHAPERVCGDRCSFHLSKDAGEPLKPKAREFKLKFGEAVMTKFGPDFVPVVEAHSEVTIKPGEVIVVREILDEPHDLQQLNASNASEGEE